MDKIESQIMILKPDAKKYGWSDQIKAKYIFTLLKDEITLIDFLKDKPKAYFYMLNYFLKTGRVKKFLTYFQSAAWSKANKVPLETLLMKSIKYDKVTIFNFLIEKFHDIYDFDNIKKVRMYLGDNIENQRAYYLQYMTRVFVIKNNIDKFPLGTMENMYNIACFDQDIILKTVFEMASSFKDISKESIKINLKEAAEMFGYKLKGSSSISI